MTTWYCPECKKIRKIALPAVEMVGYATSGRVYKCWKCRTEIYPYIEKEKNYTTCSLWNGRE